MTVGIIGCGRMGRERARHAADYGADILTSDVQTERAAELADATPRSRAVRTPQELPWHELDAVFLCTPPAYRREFVEAALAHRVAIFTEKPFAVDFSEAEEMSRAIERSGIVAAVGYMNRYRQSVRLAKEVLETSPPLAIAAYWTGGKYGVPWWSHPELSGGPFNEQATHLVDMLRYVGGEITEVRALAIAECRVAAALQLGDSCCATLLYSCDAKEKHIGIEIVTHAGRLQLSTWDFALTENTIDGRVPSDAQNPFATETQAFLNAVAGRSDGRVLCSPQDAAATQRAVDAIRAAYSLQPALSPV